ncbi:MocR-like pyridoxine biosynthesis transcription factor PdxR [Calidifontibacillus erzurumensis]|uniref:MocR-like pyridoxine biosynthesis transcription factor PdxR n=1 Tax=Calidifontibacillus erzurumensis TaxID=2741433 RepID=UPI0035B54F51
MEITPFLNRELSEPLYSQLYHWIKKEIEEGRLLHGMKMPSIRQLATHLKVSRNTVVTAYQQLESEGYLESVPKSGIWVAEIEKAALHPMEKVVPVRQEWKSSNETLINFEYGNIDLEKFPLKLWKKCISDVVSQNNNWLFEYGEKQGEFSLRQEISKYLLQSRGVHCTPEQIIITSGTQNSISLICHLLNLQQEKVAIEEPGYNGVRNVFENEGCHMEPVPLEKDGLSLEHVHLSKAKAVYITPSHQFPFGMILSISKRIKLLNWAYQTGGYIIEDDYDSEFRYKGQPIPSLKSLDEEERVIYLGTFSKSFLPSIRLSYMVLPPSLLDQYTQNFRNYNQSASPIIQRAMALFMESGEFERHIRRMRKKYQRKHQTLIKSIEQNMGSKVRIIGEDAGLHILLKLNTVSSFELIETALQKGVQVHSPLKFWLHPTS